MKRISMTYGQVLFELGIKKESLQKAQDMLHENEELLSALENPTITKKEKENVVEKLFPDDIKSFLKVVCDNDDIACFDEAVEYYDELKRKTDKIIKAEFDYVTMPKDEQLERIKQEYEKNLAQAKDEAGQIVSDARARAKNEYQNKMDQTKEEIALMRENARKDIEAEKQKTIAGLQTEIAGIALMAASKVVEKEANDKGNEKLLDDFLKEAGV